MSDLRAKEQLRARRSVLSAPKHRVLATGGKGGGQSGERRAESAGSGDEWIEQSPREELVTQFAYVAPERDPIDMELDRLLILWHEVTAEYRYERTAYRASAVTGSYQAPKHFDWQHGIIDQVTEKATARAIGDCIARIEQPWQTAIKIQARNLATGAYVWQSSRLPADKELREVILLEARNKLLVELRREGVME